MNAGGLSGVSGERLSVELKKILEGNFSCSLIKSMIELEVTHYLGFPTQPDIQEFSRVCQVSYCMNPLGMTRLAALFKTEAEVICCNEIYPTMLRSLLRII